MHVSWSRPMIPTLKFSSRKWLSRCAFSSESTAMVPFFKERSFAIHLYSSPVLLDKLDTNTHTHTFPTMLLMSRHKMPLVVKFLFSLTPNERPMSPRALLCGKCCP